MDTTRQIQAAIVRVDMAICELGRGLVEILPPVLIMAGLYLLCLAIWRAIYDRNHTRRP